MEEKLKTLTELIEKKLELLSTLEADCLQQKENIESGNLDKVDFLINKRDATIKDVDSIDEKFVGIFESIKKQYNVTDLKDIAGIDATEVKRLQDCIVAVKEKLSKIMILDKTNIVSMENLIDDNKRDLKQIRDGRKLNIAYNPKETGSIMINDGF